MANAATDNEVCCELVEFWQSHRCPKCNARNWTYHSHSERHEPIHSPERCECYSCHTEYWLMSKSDLELTYGCYDVDLEEQPDTSLHEIVGALTDVGLPKPRGCD